MEAAGVKVVFVSYEATRNESVTVGTSSVSISPDSAGKRRMIYIKNASTDGQNITVVFGNKVAVDKEGVYLAPNDSVVDADSEGYICYKGPIQAIADAAGATLAIMERML